MEGEPCTSQVGASDVPEVGESTCTQIVEESTDEEESHKNVHGDLSEGACIGKNKVNVDEVAFVDNKAIESTENVVENAAVMEEIIENASENVLVLEEIPEIQMFARTHR